jgi:hypothetical protein
MHLDDKLGLSVAEFARAVSIGRTRAFEEIRSGRLRARKIGRRTIIAFPDIEAWLSTLPTAASGKAGSSPNTSSCRSAGQAQR